MEPAEDSLVVARVIGDVVDTFERQVQLRVRYGSQVVSDGLELKPSAVAHQPRVEVGGPHWRTLYTLIMVDPDAPSPSDPTLRDTSEQTYYHGTELVGYESPRPALGAHRLVFLLFEKRGRLNIDAPGGRENFNTRAFAELYDLSPPVAAVYFNCQN